MPQLHFLNVRDGDCTWIRHFDGKNTVIDICNGNAKLEKSMTLDTAAVLKEAMESMKGLRGNFAQKNYPVNPIDYLKSFGVDNIFRFISSHPDMDHLDGIEAFFSEFSPLNFWDTNNNKEMPDFDTRRYREEDWDFYKSLRDGTMSGAPKRLTLHSDDRGKYFNENEDGSTGGSGLYVLAPTPQLVTDSNESGDYNDCSYVLLYRTSNNKRVVIGGDSHDASWEHILATHAADLKDIDLLIAPHHGRDSDRSYDFLDVLKPKLTFFGVARSEHLGYGAWRDRGLEVMTNNQGNCFVVDFAEGRMDVHCTYKTFAQTYRQEKFGKDTFFDENLKSWYIKSL